MGPLLEEKSGPPSPVLAEKKMATFAKTGPTLVSPRYTFWLSKTGSYSSLVRFSNFYLRGIDFTSTKKNRPENKMKAFWFSSKLSWS